jgi:hypothetical protein
MDEIDFSTENDEKKTHKKKRKRNSDNDGDEEEEDILDRFTDPVKKRKKQQKKEIAERERRNKMLLAGKTLSADCFNVPLSEEEVKMFEISLSEKLASEAELQKIVENTQISDIGYKRLEKVDGIYCIFDFITAASHCTEWLDGQVKKMGWPFNMTGYNPVCVSNSTEELLFATVECCKMAAKQMLLMIQAKKKEKTH